MSKPKTKLDFDYSRFDNIDDSDDEDRRYPGFDRNLNIRVNRSDREELDEQLDEKKKCLLEQGKVEEAEAVERKRPIHIDNACHVVEERTIIHSFESDATRGISENFSFTAEAYNAFKTDHADVLEKFAKADWNQSRELLLKHGDVLLNEYANSHYMFTALDEEVKENRENASKLCYQTEILVQIHRIAEPVKRPPRDLVPEFFKKFDQDPEAANAAFLGEVELFSQRLRRRAEEKKKEQEEERKKTDHIQPVRKEKLITAMYSMTREQRVGPGGLDPVDVFESLPPALQKGFELSDIELLQAVAEDIGEEEFDKHFQRCIDSGLWNE